MQMREDLPEGQVFDFAPMITRISYNLINYLNGEVSLINKYR